MASYASLYRAKAVAVRPGAIDAFVPQVFGEASITITESLGVMPAQPGMGWVFFQAGNCEFPVWAGVSPLVELPPSVNEVWIGTDAPVDATSELWYDTDAVPVPLPVTDPTPRGIVAWKQGNQAAIPLTTTNAVIYTISATLTAGRMYELKFTCRALQASQYVNFTHTCTPVIAGFAIDAYAYIPTSYNFINWDSLVIPSVTQSYAITIYGRVASGTGNAWTDGGGGVWIKDIGPAIAGQ
jgi:hypothetical protein